MSSKNDIISQIRSQKKIVFRAEKRNLTSLPMDKIREKPITSVAILSQNNLTTLAGNLVFEIANIGWKHSLIELNLCNNQIEVIPREISLFMHLRVLTFDNNRVRALPRDLGKLSHLEILSFSQNEVMDIPVEFGQLINLRKLNFSGNLIRKIPPSLGRLENLRKVMYDNNPIFYPPADVIKQGWLATRSYLSEPLKFITKKFSSGSNLTISLNQPFDGLESSESCKSNIRGPLFEMTTALRRLLAGAEGRQAFAKFLEKEFSLENLLFWQEVEHLNSIEHQLQPEDYETEATKIFCKYIQEKNEDIVTTENENTPLAINLPFEIKTRCTQIFEKYEKKPTYNLFEIDLGPSLKEIKDILREAQNSILCLLALDSYQRFCSLEDYKRLGCRSLNRGFSNSIP